MARLTFIHVVLSLVSLGSGLLQSSAFFGRSQNSPPERHIPIIAAGMSVTGFLFPVHGVTPGIVVGWFPSRS